MSTKKTLNLTLKIWRQKNRKTKGRFEIYKYLRCPPIHHFLKCLMFLMNS